MKSLDEFGSVVALAALILGACAAFGAEASMSFGNSGESGSGEISQAPQAIPQRMSNSWQER